MMVHGRFPVAHPSNKLVRASDLQISINLPLPFLFLRDGGKDGVDMAVVFSDLRAREAKLL
jgi:hypothetical protein